MSLRIGIDVGGTFTDFAVLAHATDAASELVCEKVASRHDRADESLTEGLGLLARRIGISDARALLADTGLVIYSTTVALNTMIQGTWAKTGLLCTAGFRDTIEFREGYKDNRYVWDFPAPTPIAPRHLRLPVRERVDASGRIVEPLAESDVLQSVQTFRDAGVEAAAVNFLWSFLNPHNEAEAARILREQLPGVLVVASHEIFPERREYPRESTVLLNAALAPVVNRHLERVEEQLAALGFAGTLRYMLGNGGLASPEVTKRRPILAINSGPAAAPVASKVEYPGEANLVVMDMGGTSCDVATVVGGRVAMARNRDMLSRRIGPSMVRITSLGAGGGSIARVEGGRLLRVGPDSAEAVPGPACYGLGGTKPTVTDANLVLGYLDSESLLGGRIRLRAELAEQAIATAVADPLGITVQEAALAIREASNQTMANVIWEDTVQRGLDPRDFSLVAAGGAGPLHACAIAGELGMTTVLVPRYAGTLCAVGAITAMHQHIHARSIPDEGRSLDLLNRTLADLEDRGRRDMEQDGADLDRCEVTRQAFMRYRGQVEDISIILPDGPLDSRSLAETADAFHDIHHRRFSFHDVTADLLVSGVEVVVSSSPGLEPVRAYRHEDEVPMVRAPTRECIFDSGRQTVALYTARDLAEGRCRFGPAVVAENFTTVLVAEGWQASMGASTSYVLRRI
jgi:N-methylhydantoinase A